MRLRGVILVLIVAALAILLTLVGCGGEPREVVIDESANGEAIVLQVGDTLVLKLDSNSTTGYGWQMVEGVLDEAVLELIAHEYIPREHAPGHMGVGGQEVWRFRACAKGATSLDLEYVRSWEIGVEPAEAFIAEVEVTL